MPEPKSGSINLMNRDGTLPGYKKTLVIMIVAFSIASPVSAMTGTWPRCVGTCTANDIASFSVYMSLHGTTFQVFSDIAFTSSGTRYNLHIVYDLYRNGVLLAKDVSVCLNGNGCVTPNPTTGIASGILLGTYSFIAGSSYDLRNILFLYDTSSQPCACTSGNCAVFPNSKCKTIATAVTVCPAPVLTAPNQVMCEGSSVQLNVIPSPSGSYSYSWTPATGLSSTTISNPIASPATTTTYTVTVTDTVCKAFTTAQVLVTVQPKPTASAGSYAPICNTGVVSLVGTATNYYSVGWSIMSGPGYLIIGSEPRFATFYPAWIPSQVFTQTILRFTAYPISPCSAPAISDATITVYQTPNAAVKAYY
ncbi:MAG: hypothetical protein A4E49_02310 [Methanosaeta sp. PtaU1.Bin112]|nr:MAG: hypothetical protein A4E49_02310 [Methanosaeta sp. PtaU1.Bin112]